MMEITNTIPKEYEGNDAYMNIIRRVSVRRYSDNPISSGQVSAILHAAMSAPSGVNKQPWEFIGSADFSGGRREDVKSIVLPV